MKNIVSYICCLLLVLVAFDSNGQTTNEQRVISSAGLIDSTTSLKISSTIGEPVIQTFSSSNEPSWLTQGFQQSFDGGDITFDLIITGPSCKDRNDGFAEISNIVGCDAPHSISWSNSNLGTRAVSLGVGGYSVQVTSDNGCTELVEFTVSATSDEPCLLKFYSGITPNGDGRNETWIIDNIELFPSNEVVFYNRLGNKVWEGTNYNNSSVVWGGENLSGNELPSDTYFYIFESGGDVEKGWVELTR